MKLKKLFVSAMAVMGLSVCFSIGAFAEADVVTVTVDNVAVAFDQNPIIVEGHTMVPVRAVFEQAGATVDWNQENLTAIIVKDGYTVTIKYGDTCLYKNGERVEIEAPAMIANDRILIPVRAIAEAMDFAVTWDGHHSMVLVSTTGKPYRAYAFLKTGFRTLEDASELYTDAVSGAVAIDLDNDGKNEILEFSPTQDTSRGGAPILKINDLDYTAGLGALTSAYSIAVVDIDAKNDNTKEIIVTENGDTLTAHFYRYENGILKVIDADNVTYASNLLVSGTGYMLSDLTGVCFVDIMVSGGIYKYSDGAVKIYKMNKIDSIFGRNLYRVYDDTMLYHVIYTDTYKHGTYQDITDTGVINATELSQFKLIDGFLDKDNPRYIELYIELPSGERAVIKPYQT